MSPLLYSVLPEHPQLGSRHRKDGAAEKRSVSTVVSSTLRQVATTVCTLNLQSEAAGTWHCSSVMFHTFILAGMKTYTTVNTYPFRFNLLICFKEDTLSLGHIGKSITDFDRDVVYLIVLPILKLPIFWYLNTPKLADWKHLPGNQMHSVTRLVPSKPSLDCDQVTFKHTSKILLTFHLCGDHSPDPWCSFVLSPDLLVASAPWVLLPHDLLPSLRASLL